MTSYNPHKDDLSWNYDLDFLDNFNHWNILLKVNDAVNNRNIQQIPILQTKYIKTATIDKINNILVASTTEI